MARTNNIEKLKSIGLSEESFSAGEATKIFKAAMQKSPKKQNAVSIVNNLKFSDFEYFLKIFFENYEFSNGEVFKLKEMFESSFENIKKMERERVKSEIKKLERQLKKLQ